MKHRHGERDELYYRMERNGAVNALRIKIAIVLIILSFIPSFVTRIGVSTGIIVKCDMCDDYLFAKQAKKIDEVDWALLDLCPDCYEFYINLLEKEYEPDPNPFLPSE